MELFNKIITITQKVDNTIKASAIGGMVWIILAVLLGLLTQLQLFIKLPLPTGYGILRPAYTAALLFGGILSLFNAAVYYYLNQINNGSFKFAPMAFIAFKLQQLAVFVGVITILCGYSKGREYGEFTYISDHLLMLSLLLTVIVAVLNIQESKKFPIQSSYIIATLSGMFAIYFVGNISLPFSPYASISLYTGVQDQTIQEIYRLGLLSFFIIMPMISLLVIYVPEYFEVELYSEAMGRFHILASSIILPLAGAGWLAGSAASPVLQTIGVFAYFAFFIAVIAGILNIHFTISKSGKTFKGDSLGNLLRAGGVLIMAYAAIRALFIIGIMRDLTDFTFLNTKDLSQDAASYSILILFAVIYYNFQKMNNRNFGEGSLKILLMVGGVGMVIMLASNVFQGVIQGYVSLELTDKGQLAQTTWANILSSGSVLSGDAKTASGFMQNYLGSFRGLFLIGNVMVFISVISSAGVFIINALKNGNGEYKKPSLNV